jgi:hypothetical protein
VSFAKAHREYADNLIKEYSVRPTGTLYPDPMNIVKNRESNGYIAVKLFRLFSANPEYWKATQVMPLPTRTVDEFFELWRKTSFDQTSINAIVTLLAAER